VGRTAVLGDLTGDGEVDAADVARTLDMLLERGTPTPLEWLLADADCDAKVFDVLRQIDVILARLPSPCSARRRQIDEAAIGSERAWRAVLRSASLLWSEARTHSAMRPVVAGEPRLEESDENATTSFCWSVTRPASRGRYRFRGTGTSSRDCHGLHTEHVKKTPPGQGPPAADRTT
jgi:hypothetical protein